MFFLKSKVCDKCGVEKPTYFYSVARSQKDGLCRRCKSCAKVARRSYYLERKSTPEKKCEGCGGVKSIVHFAKLRDGERVDYCDDCRIRFRYGYRFRVCLDCGQKKPVEEFYTNNAVKDGRQSICKPCSLTRSRAYIRKHYDKYLEYARRYGQTDQHKDGMRRWRREHPEYVQHYRLLVKEKGRQRIREAFSVLGDCVDCMSVGKSNQSTLVMWSSGDEFGRSQKVGIDTAEWILGNPVEARKRLIPLCGSCRKKRQVARWAETGKSRRENVKQEAFKILGGFCVDCLGVGKKTKPTIVHHRNGDGHKHLNQKRTKRLGGHELRLWVVRNPQKAKETLVPLCRSCHDGRHRAQVKAENELRIKIEVEVLAKLRSRRRHSEDTDTLPLFQ